MSGAVYPSLRDRTVVVTGGASGIGASIVRHFAAQGSRTGFIDIDETNATALVAELTGEGARVAFARADVTDIDALVAAIGHLRGQLGPVAVLVNNAAHDQRHDIADITPGYWDERMQVNLRHHFFASREVIGDMRGQGGGSIICMGSISWLIGSGGMPAYLAAKAGIHGLARGLARDLGPDNIRVNVVLPGWIMTGRQLRLWATPESEAAFIEQQCLKRRLVEQDVAPLVLFLAADDSAACTGQAFVVDGGRI